MEYHLIYGDSLKEKKWFTLERQVRFYLNIINIETTQILPNSIGLNK